MKHRIFILLITLLSSRSISAQKFVLDPLFGDSVKCSVAVKADTVWKLAEPLQHVSLYKNGKYEYKIRNISYQPSESVVYEIRFHFLGRDCCHC